MSFSSKDIERLAEMARLRLAPEELEQFAAQLDVIFGHIDQIKSLDVAGIQPMTHVVSLGNVVRPDRPRAGLPLSAIERMAPLMEQGQFVVPRILESEP